MRIVLVHLGSMNAPHLWANIKYLNSHFSNLQLVLIADNSEIIEKARSYPVEVSRYQPEARTENLLNSSKHDLTFRKGFWRFSIERIIAVTSYIKNTPDSNLVDTLHIESDILLFPSFADFHFKPFRKISWLPFNESHDVGACILFPKEVDVKYFEEEFLLILENNPELTDMTGLKKLRDKNPDDYMLLPTTLDSAPGSLVFDPAPIGMWLTGEDPRNHQGRLKLHRVLRESDIQPGNYKYSINEKSSPVLVEDESHFTLMNLHVHSKDIKLFSLQNNSQLKNFINLSQNIEGKTIFLPKIFLKQLTKFLLKQNYFSKDTWKTILLRMRHFSAK